MIYPAIVLDSTDFLKKGTIRVRIAQYYMGKMLWNLAEEPDFITLGVDKKSDSHYDFDAFVFSPIGGGKNYGVFLLPQENTRGLVAFLGNTSERGNVCFWLGSLFQPEFNEETKKLETINMPSDKVDSNGPLSDGFAEGQPNLDFTDLNGSLIIKLKSTDYDSTETDKDKTKEKLNWEKSNIENTIVINKNKVLIHHSSEYDDKQNEITSEEISIDKNNISLIIKKEPTEENKTKLITFNLNKTDVDELSFTLGTENVETKTRNIITASSVDETISITAVKEDNSSSVEITPTDVTVSSKKNTVLIDDKGITLNAPETTVYLNAKEVRLGTEDSKIVTTTYTGFFELPNGMVIKSSDRIFG